VGPSVLTPATIDTLSLELFQSTEGRATANIQQYAGRGVWDPPAYSQAVRVTRGETILCIAGQQANDDNGNATDEATSRQARAALQALNARVEAGGGTMANIVKVNTYLTEIGHRADYVPIRGEFFGKKMPAHTLVRSWRWLSPGF
jgi:2-iminobutanoate/2-iminopropanoate deaminase